jgi:hypothetical protein
MIAALARDRAPAIGRKPLQPLSSAVHCIAFMRHFCRPAPINTLGRNRRPICNSGVWPLPFAQAAILLDQVEGHIGHRDRT